MWVFPVVTLGVTFGVTPEVILLSNEDASAKVRTAESPPIDELNRLIVVLVNVSGLVFPESGVKDFLDLLLSATSMDFSKEAPLDDCAAAPAATLMTVVDDDDLELCSALVEDVLLSGTGDGTVLF